MTPATFQALQPLLSSGYTRVSESVDNRHFGDQVVVLEKGHVRVSLIREKLQWFAQLSVAGTGERFDASVVAQAAGFSLPAETHESPLILAKFLADTAPSWQPLFDRARYPETLEKLRSIEVASARERFGYVDE